MSEFCKRCNGLIKYVPPVKRLSPLMCIHCGTLIKDEEFSTH